MPTLWRISNHTSLSGIGGEHFASRWSSLGRRIVYLAESPPGALFEILVHTQFEDGELPTDYQLLEISVPDSLPITELASPGIPDWRSRVDLTQQLGDAWLESMATPLARVPSAIVPRTSNVLLNPLHPEASKIQILSITREQFDNRLFRFGSL